METKPFVVVNVSDTVDSELVYRALADRYTDSDLVLPPKEQLLERFYQFEQESTRKSEFTFLLENPMEHEELFRFDPIVLAPKLTRQPLTTAERAKRNKKRKQTHRQRLKN